MKKSFSRGQKATLVILIAVMALCAAYLLSVFVIQPASDASDTQELKNILDVSSPPLQSRSASGDQVPPTSSAPSLAEQFETLQKINPDIKGWVTVPGTSIDYPVMQSSKDTPDYYLTHTYKKEKRQSGSIYLQYDCNPDTSRNAIVFGHHMLNGSMFTALEQYDDFSFFQSHKTFEYKSAAGSSTYEIFAVLETTPSKFAFNRATFANDADFLQFLKDIQAKSLYQTGVSVTARDRIMTLATCSDKQKNGRTVVFGKKVNT